MIAVYIFLFLLVLVMIAAYVCYRLAFSVPKQSQESLFLMPDTEQYTPYAALTSQMIRDALAIPYEPISITSYDGLPLYGKCYLASPEAPWLIMFHGYRSGAERDFSGGLPFGIESGFNVLLVDQRAHGKSGGRCLTFGIKERHDCLSWIEYVRSRTEDTAKIVLYGMSMGAATVLMSTALKLPQNVVGIVADCGYTSPSAIKLTFPLCLLDLNTHTAGDPFSEHPQLGALGKQHDVHEQRQVTLFAVIVIHELGEVDVRRNGDTPGIHGKAAVSTGVLLVLHHVPGKRRADIHHRAESSERLGFLLDLRQRLIGSGVVIPLTIKFIDSHLGHLSLSYKNRRHSRLPGAAAPMPKWAFAP